MAVDDILLDAEERMEKTVGIFSSELATVRTGRANPALIENINVDYYGTKTRVRELCAISVPEPRMMMIRPYDPESLVEVEKAILKSDLGIAPQNDGKILRLMVPPMTEEVRKQMSARIKEMSQDVKTSIRNVRRDANKAVDSEHKGGSIPEDEAYKTKDDVQDLTNKYEKKVDDFVEEKTKEIMEL